MAMLQLKSMNPDFSFAIKKNPQSGMLLREIRKGIGFGWFSNFQTYNVYFKDAENDVSYKQHRDEAFEYLNTTRYNSPLAILNMISEYFDDAMKKRSKYDSEGMTTSILIPLVHIEHERYIRFFKENFAEYTLEAEQKAGKSYSLMVTTEKGIQDLLNYVGLFCLFLGLFAEEYLEISDAIIAKYLNVINTLDAPFYIRYLFGRNLLNGRDRFVKYKTLLEQTNRYDMDLKFGNTAIQRRDFIKRFISNEKSILDIGCGEGFYAIPLARNIPEHFYYAIDVNEELIDMVAKKAEKSELENVLTFNAIDSFLENYTDECVDVILTEVVEHMNEDTAAALVKTVLDNVNYDTFIITTPNADFNVFYALEGFRHDDHKWEMNTQAFEAWMTKIAPNASLEFFGIGDSVNGIHTSQGVIVRK